MHALFFILAVFILTATAQTSVLQKSFDDGIRTASSSEFDRAADTFRRVLVAAKIEKTPDNFAARVHFNLGVCLFRNNETKSAVAEFSEAVKLSQRTYAKAFYALGMAEAELKNFDQAETAFLNALKIDSTNGEAWFDLALVYLAKTDFERAETAFANAIKYKSIAAADALNNLGVIFALRRDFQNAETQFEKAISQSNGKSIEAKNNLRFCREIKEKFNQDLLAKLEFAGKNDSGE